MPRSPLLSSLQQMAENHRIAREKNVSVATVQDWRIEASARRGITRRQLMAGGGAALAAATLLGANKARAASNATIAIVGGGIAGLSCALQLADRGHASTVYEANPTRVGGRMHSNPGYFANGQVNELCGELIDTGHLTIRRLASRFNLPVVDLINAEAVGSTDTFFFFNQYYPRAQANDDFLPVWDVLQSQIHAAGYPTTFAIQNDAGRALDDISVYDWIERYVPGGHQSPMGAMLDVAYTEELAVDSRLQSSLNLVYLLGYQKQFHVFDMFGISDERFHIEGGNERLPQAIAGALAPDVVQKGFALTALRKSAAGRYTLSFAGKPDVTTDYVVLALPFSILRTLDIAGAGFDDRKNYTIQNLGAGKSGKLALQFNDRLWTQPGPWGTSNGNTYSDTGYMNTWEVTRAQPGATGILVDYTGGPASIAMRTTLAYGDASNAKVLQDANTFLGRLEHVLPGISARWNGRASSSLPHLDPNLKLSYSHWKTGQYQLIAGYEGVRQANCLFAGEHTSVDFQGFMEGGASSGQIAANVIANELK